jgi:tetratricopeptide (TPR) repeat protein
VNTPLTKILRVALFIFVISGGVAVAQVSSEVEALSAIRLATNPTTKLAAAEDFVAKFPTSKVRPDIARVIAAEILKVNNGAVALVLLERAQAVFTTDQEREILKPVALTTYAIGNRPDDAFALAREMLAKDPDDLHVLVWMTHTGAEETRKRNRKYADLSLQYGLRAIALIDSDKKPPNIASETWLAHKSNLAQLYQETAILYLAAENTQEAKTRLAKASTLAPQDPSNFALLGRIINADYVSQKSAYELMPEAKAKQDALKKLEAVLDSVIDAYAHAAGLATGRAEYQTLLQQVIPDLTAYYKYRHQSTEGLQRLINRYRPTQ